MSNFKNMQKRVAAGGAAIAMLSAAGIAHAYPMLPGLTNLNFATTANPPKGPFTSVDPTGWTGGSGLIFIDSTTAPGQDAAGPVYLTTYGDPVGAVTGNYVEADGNPIYESGFNYTVTGLTVGQTYTLSFYQGASSQTGFGYNSVTGTYSPTTNQWIVALGTPGSTIVTANNGPYNATYGPTETYSDTDPLASVTASQLMTVPYQGTVGWQYVSVNITADATTDVLSFLAWGDDGSTVNLPPIAFLSGVNSPPGLGAPVPEPSTWAMMGLGFLGLGLALRARKSKVLAAA